MAPVDGADGYALAGWETARLSCDAHLIYRLVRIYFKDSEMGNKLPRTKPLARLSPSQFLHVHAHCQHPNHQTPLSSLPPSPHPMINKYSEEAVTGLQHAN